MKPSKSAACTGLVVACLLAGPETVLAQDVADEIVVIASRRAMPVSSVGSSISVLDSVTIQQRQYTFALDALRSLPGVTINQTGALGGQASVSIRGATGDQTVILIDGVQVNDPSAPGNGYNFGHLDPAAIERIEVLRGPQSVLYGSDAIGGVVNIITKAPKSGFGGSYFAEAGSFDTVKAGTTLQAGVGRASGSLTVSGTRSSGISSADEAAGNAEEDGYRNLNLSGRLAVKVLPNLRAELLGRHSNSEKEFDSFGPVDGDEVADTDESMVAGRLFVDLFDGRLSNTVSVEHSEIDRKNVTNGATSFRATGVRTNYDYLGNLTLGAGWGLGFGAQRESVKAKTVSPETFTIDSLFTELSWEGIEGLALTAGVRRDDHDTFGDTTNVRLTGSYTFAATGTRLIANWGEGFKAPSIFQLTYVCVACGHTQPSRDLRPEVAEAWEAGVEQSLFDDRLLVGATYFAQDTKDLIAFDFINGYQNINRSRARGVETRLDWDVFDNLTASANYTYTLTEDRDTGRELIRHPKHLATMSLNWQATQQLSAGLDLTYTGSQLDTGNRRIDDWKRVDVKLAYAVTEAVEIYGRVENLFDEQYQQVTGYGTPGVSAYLGVRGRF